MNNTTKLDYVPKQSNYRKVLSSRTMANGDVTKMPYSEIEPGFMCRLCLSPRGQICNIFLAKIQPVPLPKLIYSCTGVVVEEYDGLPDIICDSCYRKLKIFKSFRDQCQRSDQILRNIASSTKNTKSTARQDLKLNFKLCKNVPHESHKSYCLRRKAELKKLECAGTKSITMKQSHDVKVDDSLVVPVRNRLVPYPSRLFRKRRRMNYACKLCGKGFLRRANLTIHLRNHSSDKHGGARETAENNDSTVHHDRTYPEISYICKMCLHRFPDKSTLMDHFQSHEEREECFSLPLEHITDPRESYADIKGITVYTCKSCKKQFIDKDNLKAHIKLHQSDSKENACDLCDKEDLSGKKKQDQFDSYKDMFKKKT